MAKGYLCVGGPYNGKMYAHPRGAPSFRLASWDRGGDGYRSPFPVRMPELLTTTYVLRALAPQPNDIMVWVPEKQTVVETLVKLLENYENSSTKGAKNDRS